MINVLAANSKIRMTGPDAANMNSDKLPMFAIGK